MARKPPAAESELPCFSTAVRKASRRLTQLYDEALAASGLRSTQFTILAEIDLRSKPPPTVAALARRLVMDRSALGHNLRPLVRDGLVRLEASDRDQRRRQVTLTAKGLATLRAAMPLWRRAQERVGTVLGAATARELRATMLAIAQNERLATLTG